MIDGTGRIQAERQRQITEEGFSLLQDEKYVKQELIKAARGYLVAAEFAEVLQDDFCTNLLPPTYWPWQLHWWRPSADPIRNLEKAGALIAAEIDRLKRAAATTESEEPK